MMCPCGCGRMMDPKTGLYFPDRAFGQQKEKLLKAKRGASDKFHRGAQVERTLARKLKRRETQPNCLRCGLPLGYAMEIDRYDSTLDYTPENIRGLIHPWCHRGVYNPYYGQ